MHSKVHFFQKEDLSRPEFLTRRMNGRIIRNVQNILEKL
jgi:hypothetical protein